MVRHHVNSAKLLAPRLRQYQVLANPKPGPVVLAIVLDTEHMRRPLIDIDSTPNLKYVMLATAV